MKHLLTSRHPKHIALRLSIITFILVSFAFYITRASAAFPAPGFITSDTTWTLANSPYVVHCCNSITVIPGVTLTIEPGVVVKFDVNTGMFINGTLKAQGTETNPIYFTSLFDDTVGGDTNNDGNATVPNPFQWNHLQFNEGSAGVFDHTVVRYGGMFPQPVTGIENDGGLVTVDHSQLTLNGFDGFVHNAGTSTITNSEFANHTFYGIVVNGFGGGFTMHDSTIHDNGQYGLYNLDTVFIDATNNYWGSPTGPTHPSNPGGTGQVVSGTATVVPFLTCDPLLGVSCAPPTLGEQASALAKLVIGDPYLGDGSTWGGKGWDSASSTYVSVSKIGSGYNYWNNSGHPPIGVISGAGLDCSGLVEWAYNRAFDPTKPVLKNVIRFPGANAEYVNNSTTTTESELKPGDLLFLDKNGDGKKDHVAMYVGTSGLYDIVEARSVERGIATTTVAKFKERPGFVANRDVRHTLLSPTIAGQVRAGSPIDLNVTDPDGFNITGTTSISTDEELLREVPGQLYYSESELGPDGRPESVVYWPVQKTGDYLVKVTPQTGVSPSATYSLTFQSGSTSIVLAQNVPISQIPKQGYGITTSGSGTINSFIPVAIDISPGKSPNNINLGSHGTLLAAIFGSATLDVHNINYVSVTLANVAIVRKNNGKPTVKYKDLNKDGFPDALVRFPIQALNLTAASTQANLVGQLLSGTAIKGSDSVRIVSTQENEDDADKDAND